MKKVLFSIACSLVLMSQAHADTWGRFITGRVDLENPGSEICQVTFLVTFQGSTIEISENGKRSLPC